MIDLKVPSESLQKQYSRVLADQGILQRVAEMLQEYFPETERDIAKQSPASLILQTENGFLSYLHQFTELYGGSEGNLKERVERALDEAPDGARKFIEHGLDFLEQSGYHEITPLAVVNRALDTARKQSEADADKYAILKDLGDGVHNAYWFHNPREPRDWGRSLNDGIMRDYRELLPSALEKHNIKVSDLTLGLLLELPYNGAQAAQLIKYTIDQLETEEKGVCVEPETNFNEQLPGSLLKFAKDKNYYNAQRIDRSFFPFNETFS